MSGHILKHDSERDRYTKSQSKHLRERDLRERELREKDLRERDLRGRDLRGRDLRGRDLRERDLRERDARGRDLRDKSNKEADIYTRSINLKFKGDTDPVYLQNIELIREQTRLWEKNGNELEGFIDEFNKTFQQLFELNHIHTNPYDFNSFTVSDNDTTSVAKDMSIFQCPKCFVPESSESGYLKIHHFDIKYNSEIAGREGGDCAITKNHWGKCHDSKLVTKSKTKLILDDGDTGWAQVYYTAMLTASSSLPMMGIATAYMLSIGTGGIGLALLGGYFFKKVGKYITDKQKKKILYSTDETIRAAFRCTGNDKCGEWFRYECLKDKFPKPTNEGKAGDNISGFGNLVFRKPLFSEDYRSHLYKLHKDVSMKMYENISRTGFINRSMGKLKPGLEGGKDEYHPKDALVYLFNEIKGSASDFSYSLPGGNDEISIIDHDIRGKKRSIRQSAGAADADAPAPVPDPDAADAAKPSCTDTVKQLTYIMDERESIFREKTGELEEENERCKRELNQVEYNARSERDALLQGYEEAHHRQMSEQDDVHNRQMSEQDAAHSQEIQELYEKNRSLENSQGVLKLTQEDMVVIENLASSQLKQAEINLLNITEKMNSCKDKLAAAATELGEAKAKLSNANSRGDSDSVKEQASDLVEKAKTSQGLAQKELDRVTIDYNDAVDKLKEAQGNHTNCKESVIAVALALPKAVGYGAAGVIVGVAATVAQTAVLAAAVTAGAVGVVGGVVGGVGTALYLGGKKAANWYSELKISGDSAGAAVVNDSAVGNDSAVVNDSAVGNQPTPITGISDDSWTIPLKPCSKLKLMVTKQSFYEQLDVWQICPNEKSMMLEYNKIKPTSVGAISKHTTEKYREEYKKIQESYIDELNSMTSTLPVGFPYLISDFNHLRQLKVNTDGESEKYTDNELILGSKRVKIAELVSQIPSITNLPAASMRSKSGVFDVTKSSNTKEIVVWTSSYFQDKFREMRLGGDDLMSIRYGPGIVTDTLNTIGELSEIQITNRVNLDDALAVLGFVDTNVIKYPLYDVLNMLSPEEGDIILETYYQFTIDPVRLKKYIEEEGLHVHIPDDVVEYLRTLPETSTVKNILSALGITGDVKTSDLKDKMGTIAKSMKSIPAYVSELKRLEEQYKPTKLNSLIDKEDKVAVVNYLDSRYDELVKQIAGEKAAIFWYGSVKTVGKGADLYPNNLNLSKWRDNVNGVTGRFHSSDDELVIKQGNIFLPFNSEKEITIFDKLWVDMTKEEIDSLPSMTGREWTQVQWDDDEQWKPEAVEGPHDNLTYNGIGFKLSGGGRSSTIWETYRKEVLPLFTLLPVNQSQNQIIKYNSNLEEVSGSGSGRPNRPLPERKGAPPARTVSFGGAGKGRRRPPPPPIPDRPVSGTSGTSGTSDASSASSDASHDTVGGIARPPITVGDTTHSTKNIQITQTKDLDNILSGTHSLVGDKLWKEPRDNNGNIIDPCIVKLLNIKQSLITRSAVWYKLGQILKDNIKLLRKSQKDEGDTGDTGDEGDTGDTTNPNKSNGGVPIQPVPVEGTLNPDMSSSPSSPSSPEPVPEQDVSHSKEIDDEKDRIPYKDIDELDAQLKKLEMDLKLKSEVFDTLEKNMKRSVRRDQAGESERRQLEIIDYNDKKKKLALFREYVREKGEMLTILRQLAGKLIKRDEESDVDKLNEKEQTRENNELRLRAEMSEISYNHQKGGDFSMKNIKDGEIISLINKYKENDAKGKSIEHEFVRSESSLRGGGEELGNLLYMTGNDRSKRTRRRKTKNDKKKRTKKK